MAKRDRKPVQKGEKIKSRISQKRRKKIPQKKNGETTGE